MSPHLPVETPGGTWGMAKSQHPATLWHSGLESWGQQPPGTRAPAGEHGTWGLLAWLPNACGPTEVLEQSEAFLEYFCPAGARLGPSRGISPVNK